MSLKIEKKNTEPKTLALIGRLDTVTAPELEAEISTILPTAESLVLDMEKLDYISSAGCSDAAYLKQEKLHIYFLTFTIPCLTEPRSRF